MMRCDHQSLAVKSDKLTSGEQGKNVSIVGSGLVELAEAPPW